MLVPLILLAILSTVGGFVGPPMQHGGAAFERWLRPVFADQPGFSGVNELVGAASWELFLESIKLSERAIEWLLIAVSVAAAAVGIFLAFRLYLLQPDLAAGLQRRWSAVYRLFLNKYWVDELYEALVVRTVFGTSQRLWRLWDEKVVDGIVNGVGHAFEVLSTAMRALQTGFVGTYAMFFALGVLALLLYFVRHS
jgi:NADH-quinone oxidoreductase subunit L